MHDFLDGYAAHWRPAPNRALSLFSYLSHCISILKVPFNHMSLILVNRGVGIIVVAIELVLIGLIKFLSYLFGCGK